MGRLVRCRVCGLIIDESKLKDKCPACGFPRTVFEPYEEKMSIKRKKLLNLDLHPILVHFPEAFSTIIFLLTLFTLIAPALYRDQILGTILILSFLLPFFTVLAIFSGIIDGKTRFKKLKTILLIRKIIIGTIFLILAILLILTGISYGIVEIKLVFMLLLSLGCLICGTLLGLIGKTLNNALIVN
jgi:rubredoxin